MAATNALAFLGGLAAAAIAAEPPAWNSPPVFEMNGRAAPIRLSAQSRLVSEDWVRVASMPYLAYIPEKHRVLMLVSLDYPHRPALLHSDDYGETWSDPVYFSRRFTERDDGAQAYTDALALAYLGKGRVTWVGQYRGAFSGQFSYSATFKRWFGEDCGETWNSRPLAIEPAFTTSPDGRQLKDPVNLWDPMLVDKDPRTGRTTLYQTSYLSVGNTMSGGYAWAYLQTSADGGRTWSKPIRPAQWGGVNEVALCRAKNGDLVAACRTISPGQYQTQVDNWNGLGISISRDNGRSWSAVVKLYNWGRHHPSMVVMPNGDIVMSHVVRRGYTDDPAGYPRFGIEAIVSRDHGRNWDLDHKYILAAWSGTIKREGNSLSSDRKYDWDWLWPNPQNTSSILLPDDSILTVFGTGFRMQKVKVGLVLPTPTLMRVPYDIGIVRWKPNHHGLNNDHSMANSAYDSSLRNMFDPGIIFETR